MEVTQYTVSDLRDYLKHIGFVENERPTWDSCHWTKSHKVQYIRDNGTKFPHARSIPLYEQHPDLDIESWKQNTIRYLAHVENKSQQDILDDVSEWVEKSHKSPVPKNFLKNNHLKI